MEKITFLQYIERIMKVPVILLDGNGEIQSNSPSRFPGAEQRIPLNEYKILALSGVALRTEPDESTYGCAVIGEGELCLLGPVRFTYVSGAESATYCSFRPFAELLLFLHEYFTGERITLSDFLGQSSSYEEMSRQKRTRFERDQQEKSWKHNSYEEEKREQDAIRRGDVEQLRAAIGEPLIGQYGQTSRDRLRSVKNTAIIMMGLSTRSAIEGGVPYEEAFRFCDQTNAQIEALNTIEEIVHVARSAEETLARMVNDRAKDKQAGPYIEQCRQYVYEHLREKISLKDLADHCGLTPAYLSALYRKETGKSVTEYIQERKIYYAENLLTYSDYGFDEIADYFGFSSRSHFGAVFRKITGMTPKEYRVRYRAEGFFTEKTDDTDGKKEEH